MNPALGSPLLLRELRAPAGWTAALLEAPLPMPEHEQAPYLDAVASLLLQLPAFAEPHPEELFLLFEHCRPDVEIPILQANARFWLPQIGLGVWLERQAPTTWTAEEFLAAAPGTLRPVIDRIVRLTRDPDIQRDAWDRLLGSGTLVRLSTSAPDRFLAEATEFLQPRMIDRSLTSFPFYVPLLNAASLNTPSPAFRAPLHDLLPQTEAYLRESVEDGGLLLAVRQPPVKFWETLLQKPALFEILRLATHIDV